MRHKQYAHPDAGGPGFGSTVAAAFAYDPFELHFQGTLYGRSYDQTFSTVDDYMGWRTSIAALSESQVYATFAVMCQNMGCDPNQKFQVGYENATSSGVLG